MYRRGAEAANARAIPPGARPARPGARLPEAILRCHRSDLHPSLLCGAELDSGTL